MYCRASLFQCLAPRVPHSLASSTASPSLLSTSYCNLFLRIATSPCRILASSATSAGPASCLCLQCLNCRRQPHILGRILGATPSLFCVLFIYRWSHPRCSATSSAASLGLVSNHCCRALTVCCILAPLAASSTCFVFSLLCQPCLSHG